MLLFPIDGLTATADVTPISQTRSLEFSSTWVDGLYYCTPGSSCQPLDVTTIDNQGDDQATDFAAWVAGFEGSSPEWVGANQVEIDSSGLGAAGVTVSATHSGYGSGGFGYDIFPVEVEISRINSASTATLSYTFEVDEPTLYHLTGRIEVGDGSWGPFEVGYSQARLRLEGPAGQDLHLLELLGNFECIDGCDQPDPETIDVSGILSPGIYTLEADLDAYAYGNVYLGGLGEFGYGADYSGSVEASLTFPEPEPPLAVPALGVPGLLLLAFSLGGVFCRAVFSAQPELRPCSSQCLAASGRRSLARFS